MFCAPSFDDAVAATFCLSDRATLSVSHADPGPRLRQLETIELSDASALALAGRIENVGRQRREVSDLQWLDGTSGLVRIAWPDGSSTEAIGHFSVDVWMREVGIAVASVAAEAPFRRPARHAALTTAADLDPGFEHVRLSGPPWHLRIAPRLYGPRLLRAAVERIGSDEPVAVDLTDCRLDEHLLRRMVRFGQTHPGARWKLCPEQVAYAEAAGLAPIDVVVGD
ncbi:MAG: hypothetical protein ABMA64_24875 [Myxococcota bacterium]